MKRRVSLSTVPPLPSSATKTLIGGIGVARSNFGLTERAAFMESMQVSEVPVQSGVVLMSPSGSTSHPPKVEPAAGVAVSVTNTELPKVASQVAPQLIPAGLEVTVPEPNPVFTTCNSGSSSAWANSTIAIKTTASPNVNT